jgi:DNA sulfur modification protein DndD
MAIIIEKIELCNWFGYRGSYEENAFDFSDGVNIIVASNDVGKSKLHNAFRWIISDKVILKDIENKYSLVNIDINNIYEVLNHGVLNQLKNEETASLGVRLTFKEIDRNEDKKSRIITKELVCKKDLDKIIVYKQIEKVQIYERGNIRTSPETFEDVKKRIIRDNLKDFFLVQGESLEHLTPLKGENLRKTINSLVSINDLDNKCNTSIKLALKITKLRQDIEAAENSRNKQASTNTRRKNELENEINDIKR